MDTGVRYITAIRKLVDDYSLARKKAASKGDYMEVAKYSAKIEAIDEIMLLAKIEDNKKPVTTES